ncbi:hypothetical protein [Pedobacter miscanthi]|jgi:hypothetical protein|uniref:Uncharacterized protein n=1 Tax=Pedobacter miscanthi TaxID=2259170 RepID=A0A366LFH0_9SPHI|nr:hypothetical protein [Pedobacter miscanthi]RBQ12024.1 hypothetical protein DRW42_01845 [Pedobacter miscanthi]
MSILADTTEKKALYEIAKTLRFFENLECLQISAGDAVRIRHAENIIKSVIGGNGFDAVFSKRRGTHLIKQKP